MNLQAYKDNFPKGTSLPTHLEHLLAFQNQSGDWYSGYFQLDTWPFGQAHWFGGDRPSAEQFVVLGRGPDGSLYALWVYPGIAVDDAPVIFLGSEGVGCNLLAKDLDEFFGLLAVGAEELGFEVRWGKIEEAKQPAKRLAEFRLWLKNTFDIEPPKKPMKQVEEARRQHPDFSKWMTTWQASRR